MKAFATIVEKCYTEVLRLREEETEGAEIPVRDSASKPFSYFVDTRPGPEYIEYNKVRRIRMMDNTQIVQDNSSLVHTTNFPNIIRLSWVFVVYCGRVASQCQTDII